VSGFVKAIQQFQRVKRARGFSGPTTLHEEGVVKGNPQSSIIPHRWKGDLGFRVSSRTQQAKEVELWQTPGKGR